jgi:hypothetical protein
MRRVWLSGGAIAVGDGVLLGTSAALGWTVVLILAVVIGAVGTLRVVMATPPPKPAAQPATVTLGVPMREPAEETATEELEPRTLTVPEVAAPVAA